MGKGVCRWGRGPYIGRAREKKGRSAVGQGQSLRCGRDLGCREDSKKDSIWEALAETSCSEGYDSEVVRQDS